MVVWQMRISSPSVQVLHCKTWQNCLWCAHSLRVRGKRGRHEQYQGILLRASLQYLAGGSVIILGCRNSRYN